jgi:hypothetical protein
LTILCLRHGALTSIVMVRKGGGRILRLLLWIMLAGLAGAERPTEYFVQMEKKAGAASASNRSASVPSPTRSEAPGRIRTGEKIHISLADDDQSQDSFVVVASAVAAIVGFLLG